MDGQNLTPAPLRQRFIRLMVVLACATLSSAVIGAVTSRPAGERAAASPVREAEPVPMISTAELADAATAAYRIEALRPARPAPPARPVRPVERAAPAELLCRVVKAPQPITPKPTRLQPTNPPPVAQPLPAVRTMLMEVTAYCPCKRCCGPNAQGITASGKDVSYNGGRFVAADTSLLPFGTRLEIPGYADGMAVEVIDRGGAIKGNKLDVYFPSHEVARHWGRRWITVRVIE